MYKKGRRSFGLAFSFDATSPEYGRLKLSAIEGLPVLPCILKA